MQFDFQFDESITFPIALNTISDQNLPEKVTWPIANKLALEN